MEAVPVGKCTPR